MSWDERYHQILREFAALSGAEPDVLGSDTELSFEYEGLLAFIFQHPQSDALVIDVEILDLSPDRGAPAGPAQWQLLHQLNGVTRFTHGAMAFLSVDQVLMLTQSLPVPGLTGQGLADALSELLDAAASLRQAWDDLRRLIVQAGQAVELQASVGLPPGSGQLA